MMPADRRPCSGQRLRGAVVPAPVLVLVLVTLPVAVTAPYCKSRNVSARSVPLLASHTGRGIGTGTYGFCPGARACAPGSRRRASSRRGSQSPCSSISKRAANVRSQAHARGALPAHSTECAGAAVRSSCIATLLPRARHPTPPQCRALPGVGAAAAPTRSTARRSTGEGRYVKVRRESWRSKSRDEG